MPRPSSFDPRPACALTRCRRLAAAWSSLACLACGASGPALAGQALQALAPGGEPAAQPWQFSALRIATIVLLMLGGFMLTLATVNRPRVHVVHFALAALALASCLAPAWWTLTPFASGWPAPVQAALWAAAVAWTILFLAGFIHRAMPRWRRALWLQCVLLPILMLLPADLGAAVARLLGLALLLQLTLALAIAVHACWPERRTDAWALLTGSVLTLTLGLADAWWAPAEGASPLSAAAWGHGPAMAWSALLVTLGVRLLHQFRLALVEAEANRSGLETTLREISAEIERNFSQLSEMRVAQVTEQERKRIAADLHDDLGAKLLTIVHTCDNERIAALGREALDEMRLSVRGLSGRPMPLADAMADWRAETVQRLAQTNIQVEWRGLDEDPHHLLPARTYVQTTRIVREAVSNIIKHSGASRCEVQCFVSKGEYGLEIQDNGRGINAASPAALDRGHGLANMKHRARQLQGRCVVDSDAGLGTLIRLSLPL